MYLYEKMGGTVVVWYKQPKKERKDKQILIGKTATHKLIKRFKNMHTWDYIITYN